MDFGYPSTVGGPGRRGATGSRNVTKQTTTLRSNTYDSPPPTLSRGRPRTTTAGMGPNATPILKEPTMRRVNPAASGSYTPTPMVRTNAPSPSRTHDGSVLSSTTGDASPLPLRGPGRCPSEPPALTIRSVHAPTTATSDATVHRGSRHGGPLTEPGHVNPLDTAWHQHSPSPDSNRDGTSLMRHLDVSGDGSDGSDGYEQPFALSHVEEVAASPLVDADTTRRPRQQQEPRQEPVAALDAVPPHSNIPARPPPLRLVARPQRSVLPTEPVDTVSWAGGSNGGLGSVMQSLNSSRYPSSLQSNTHVHRAEEDATQPCHADNAAKTLAPTRPSGTDPLSLSSNSAVNATSGTDNDERDDDASVAVSTSPSTQGSWIQQVGPTAQASAPNTDEEATRVAELRATGLLMAALHRRRRSSGDGGGIAVPPSLWVETTAAGATTAGPTANALDASSPLSNKKTTNTASMLRRGSWSAKPSFADIVAQVLRRKSTVGPSASPTSGEAASRRQSAAEACHRLSKTNQLSLSSSVRGLNNISTNNPFGGLDDVVLSSFEETCSGGAGEHPHGADGSSSGPANHNGAPQPIIQVGSVTLPVAGDGSTAASIGVSPLQQRQNRPISIVRRSRKPSMATLRAMEYEPTTSQDVALNTGDDCHDDGAPLSPGVRYDAVTEPHVLRVHTLPTRDVLPLVDEEALRLMRCNLSVCDLTSESHRRSGNFFCRCL